MLGGRFLSRRRMGRLGIAGILALSLFVLTAHLHGGQRDHYLDPHGAMGRIGSTVTDESSDTQEWGLVCRDHGFSLFHRPRKVYDLVLFSTELDWLEIRLHAHAPYVDYFVIVESTTTFTKEAKPLLLKENWGRFKKFHHLIIHRVVKDPITSSRTWDHEDWQRNSLLREVFPNLAGERQAATKGDVLIVSDMDELIRPGALLLLRHCDFPKRLTLRTHFYYYSFQWLHRGEQWAHPQATIFEGSVERTIAPNDLRVNLIGPGLLPFAALSRWWDGATLWNAGWHCSSCFSTIREMQTKMQSFSHQGWNTENNRDARTMLHRVKNGLDLFDRPDEIYDKIEDNRDVPQYISSAFKSQGRFRYLLNRDGDDAGFEDWLSFTSHLTEVL